MPHMYKVTALGVLCWLFVRPCLLLSSFLLIILFLPNDAIPFFIRANLAHPKVYFSVVSVTCDGVHEF